MAEFVDLRLEEMLPELEQMQRVELFNDQEIKAIVKKRRDFEYKLQKHTKMKEDFLKYIQYEINLLTLVRIRRNKIGYQFKKPEIDYAIANRINKMFMYATARFPTDLKIWLSHIEFCKRMKWNSSITRIFVRLLAMKSNDPSLWIMAAKWEFEDNGSAANGRGLLLRALRFHPESIQLYTEAFRLELLEADRLRKRREVLGLSCEADLPEGEEETNSILEGQLAILFYNDAKNAVKSASDLLPFLAVVKDFDFTFQLRQTILSDMKVEHSEDEITWDTVARNTLEKVSTDKDVKLKDRIELCCSTYEEAIERIDTPKMWQLFVDTLFFLFQNEIIRPKIRQRIHHLCHRALMNEKLSDEQLTDWISMMENDSLSGYQLKSVLAEAVRQFPKNATLWVKSLKAELEQKEEEPLFQIDTGASDELPPAGDDEKSAAVFVELPALFWEAIKALGSTADSIPVWETAIEHYQALCYDNTEALQTVENLYQKALSVEPPVGNHFKPLYLNWIATQKGRDEARKLYQSQAALPPLVLDFHYKMIQVELNESHPDLEFLRQVYEKAAMYFGQKNKEIWLRFIRFELERGDPTRVGNLHHRAKMTLDRTLSDDFLVQYTLLQLQA
ncbi:hypothetical protein DAPPUDRAFT_226035 [Daphnia pulex]|uniref:U3 small nucleolar RNA-associated protein 6 homolog n=1 Tax=Daphnia pulex TaxID=6669 RepID=E9GVM3_DAPPU|nr:hypothetical protein DAPPUDRAFT_226035 [Daphnia pulex]|eukprot:EFX76504.1 hypothetical protein DAPPUDRAFT_226035 [Daphnia pulex]